MRPLRAGLVEAGPGAGYPPEIPHRLEGDELVVRASDEPKVDVVIARVQQAPPKRRQKQPTMVVSAEGGAPRLVWEEVVRPASGDAAGGRARGASGPCGQGDDRSVLYPSERWNGLAIASFIVGLLAVFPFACSIIALVLGLVGLSQANARNERGRGLAKWGIALGVVGLVLWGSWTVVAATDISRAGP